jgi:transient receptor potential cation channel subfamily V protein 6
MILAGSKEEHLNMLDGGIIQRLLEEKWKTFAQRQFFKRITIALIHLIAMSVSVYLRPKDRDHSLTKWEDAQDVVRMLFEFGTVCGCLSFVVVQQGEEIKNQGLLSFLKGLPKAPPKALFLIANLLILSCIPFRLSGDVQTEESLLAFTMVFSWFFMMFFAG